MPRAGETAAQGPQEHRRAARSTDPGAEAVAVPGWLAGRGDALGKAVDKALLLFVAGLVGLRLAHRRTLAQWTTTDVREDRPPGPESSLVVRGRRDAAGHHEGA